jgi:hypothetical protein
MTASYRLAATIGCRVSSASSIIIRAPRARHSISLSKKSALRPKPEAPTTCSRLPVELTVSTWTPASALVRATSWASASRVPTRDRLDATLEAALAIAASRRSRSRLSVTSRKDTTHRR